MVQLDKTPGEGDVSVLVVDDNEINLAVAQLMLEALGCTTHSAQSGQDAVERLRANDYDLVLLDCQMPIVDGYEVARIAREQLGLKELPIIALTADPSESARTQAPEAGMNGFLDKPLDPDRLEAMLKKYSTRS